MQIVERSEPEMQNYRDLVAVGQGQFGVSFSYIDVRATFVPHLCLAQVAYKATNKIDGELYCIKRIPMKGGGVSRNRSRAFRGTNN